MWFEVAPSNGVCRQGIDFAVFKVSARIVHDVVGCISFGIFYIVSLGKAIIPILFITIPIKAQPKHRRRSVMRGIVKDVFFLKKC